MPASPARHPPAEAALPAPDLALLDGVATAILVLDAALTIRLANAAARAMADAGAGLRFRPLPGGARALALPWRADAAALHRQVGAVAMAGAAGGALCLHDAEGAPAAAALLSPVPAREAAPGGRRVPGLALVRLHRLAGPAAPPSGLLAELFGLTRAEAEVACALAGGASKASVARRRGLSACTVCTQVRAVLAKTGAANLRDLERLLAGLAAM